MASKAGREEYHKFINKGLRSALHVLLDFPSVKVPVDHLLELMPHLQPRYDMGGGWGGGRGREGLGREKGNANLSGTETRHFTHGRLTRAFFVFVASPLQPAATTPFRRLIRSTRRASTSLRQWSSTTRRATAT